MTIGLSLSDEMLKNVEHTTTALEMWTEVCNVHQRHTLLNKLTARRDFYTATMRSGEKILPYINRVRQMACTLESMGVAIDEKEMAMAVLNGLPDRFQSIITALDAIGDDDDSFTFDKVRSRLLQEEIRSQIRGVRDSTRAALLNNMGSSSTFSSSKKCSHCGMTNHTEPYCWQKYGNSSGRRSNNHSRSQTRRKPSTAAVTTSKELTEDEETSDIVCLLTSFALTS